MTVGPREYISMKLHLKVKIFHSQKITWKFCRSSAIMSRPHYVKPAYCLLHTHGIPHLPVSRLRYLTWYVLSVTDLWARTHEQNGWYTADDMSICNFKKEYLVFSWNCTEACLEGSNDKATLVHAVGWQRTGIKPLLEPILTHPPGFDELWDISLQCTHIINIYNSFLSMWTSTKPLRGPILTKLFNACNTSQSLHVLNISTSGGITYLCTLLQKRRSHPSHIVNMCHLERWSLDSAGHQVAQYCFNTVYVQCLHTEMAVQKIWNGWVTNRERNIIETDISIDRWSLTIITYTWCKHNDNFMALTRWGVIELGQHWMSWLLVPYDIM